MDEKEILRELLEEFRMFKETLYGINSNAKELSEDQKKANAELKKQNEAGLAAKKKADEDEAKQAWEKLTEEEKQSRKYKLKEHIDILHLAISFLLNI